MPKRDLFHLISLVSRNFRNDFSQSYCPLKFSILHIRQFLSELFLSNLLQEFNETLWKASLPTGDVHIISRLWLDDFTQSYGPLKFSINCTYSAILVRAISPQLLTGIQ